MSFTVLAGNKTSSNRVDGLRPSLQLCVAINPKPWRVQDTRCFGRRAEGVVGATGKPLIFFGHEVADSRSQ